MDLKDAYQGWQTQQENVQLFRNTREAFRMAWFALPTNKPCAYYTKDVLGRALNETRVADDMKASAASVMVHVLDFAHAAEPDENPKPQFTFSDLMKYMKTPEEKPVRKGRPVPMRKATGVLGRMIEELKEEKAAAESPGVSQEEHDKIVDECVYGKEPEMVDEDDLPKEESVSEEPKPEKKVKAKQGRPAKKPKVKKTKAKKTTAKKAGKGPGGRGRDARPFAQIDPETLEVVKVWATMKAARRGLGAQNLGRAMTQLRKSVGFYWCDAGDIETFTGRLRAKKELERMIARKRESVRAKDAKRDGNPPPVFVPVPMQLVTDRAGELEPFTDVELFRELERRGWHIELRRTAVAGIG